MADLAQHYGVARNTVIEALRRLADDGLVEIVPSWGTFRARSQPRAAERDACICQLPERSGDGQRAKLRANDRRREESPGYV